ncbi:MULTISPECIES: hypothetical protein [unclassified Oceanispirochaeta]|uniref:hypothetical protein n=1 Tax=unclassified Oceanispirochaeta TaxID=2635722 RepID=UPI000E095A02|nr:MULTISPECIES: hypothetical protein [unclassified Oceanispirochaeta]MBF9018737.1 hypothetical protein [Oceanispirochaeta sp. M2]NPD75175.1 hypothetical protein [Oceanispirochaeta sp. M1]RDG28959.1 hypothetical protein DV872_24070 [Oceanispirochaeta sp. M1]
MERVYRVEHSWTDPESGILKTIVEEGIIRQAVVMGMSGPIQEDKEPRRFYLKEHPNKTFTSDQNGGFIPLN